MQRGDERSDERLRQPVRVRELDQSNVRPYRGGEHARERRRERPAAAAAVAASSASSSSPRAAASAAAPPAVAVAVRVRVGIRTAAGIRTDARARSGLAREPAVQSGQARGRHRSRELLVRLPRGASLDEPRGYQLREPARVLEVDAGEELARFSRRERRDVRAVVRAVVACGPFYTSDCRGGVQRRQVELKGAEGGD